MKLQLLPLLLLFSSTGVAQYKAPVPRDKKQHWGLGVHGGVMFRDHAALSKVLYGNPDVLPNAFYVISGTDIDVAWNRFYFVGSGGRVFYDNTFDRKDYLEVLEGNGALKVGYELFVAEGFSVIPLIGIAYSESRITFMDTTASQTTVRGVLQSGAVAQRFDVDQLYLQTGLRGHLPLHFKNALFQKQLFLRFTLEYQQLLGDSLWRLPNGKELDGDRVFANNLFTRVGVGIWL
jgi:hypothetical protein